MAYKQQFWGMRLVGLPGAQMKPSWALDAKKWAAGFAEFPLLAFGLALLSPPPFMDEIGYPALYIGSIIDLGFILTNKT